MPGWFNGVARCARLEAAHVLTHPREWIAGIFVPLLWVVIIALAFGQGLLMRLPVGFVDLDRSALSRETFLALSALPSTELLVFENSLEADRAIRAGRTYATITVPEDYEYDNRRGTGAPVALEINKSYYAIGTILEVDVKTALSNLSVARLAVRAASAMGGTFTENARHLRATFPDVHFLGNTGFNFVAYLLPTLIPGLTALGALLSFVCMFSREWREGGMRRMMDAAGGSVSAVVAGKLLPWLTVWLTAITVWAAGFAGWAGWGAAGPMILWFTAGWLLILSMAGLALMTLALSPSWVIALSASICLIAPTFPFTGFSFPLDAMTPGARLFGSFLPLTHYLEAQAQIWVLGSPLDAVARTQLIFALLPLGMFAIAMPFLAARVRKLVRTETAGEELTEAALETPGALTDSAARPRTGFWKTFLLSTRHAFLSRDTIAILGTAVAFYLVFYGWPYGEQQIENIPTGIVDLDRSGVSRRLINAIDGTPAARVAFVAHSEAEGLDAFRRSKVDVLITIPPGYSEDLAGMKNSTLHVLGSGAYPVKARAIQGAVTGVLTDPAARADLASVLTPGTPAATLMAMKLAAPSVLVSYRFNEISGYGNYTVPMVGPVIVQAVMLMGIGMAVGGWLARRPREAYLRDAVLRPWCEGLGMVFAFWVIAFAWFLYMQGFAFWSGDYGAMENPPAVLLVSACFTAAVTAFGLAIVTTVRSNAWTAPVTVILSAPSLFVSGAVWPVENLHPVARGIAQIIPTTPGIIASAAAAQDGAALADILPACLHLVLLTALYGIYALMRLGTLRESGRAISSADLS
ncbi:ABC transporter permease [Sutterella sp.]|uniref:ABC transporter permease n=1 Tax=Sutterella sp. TaxID=1981025 RepID=UPI0026E030F0|nr:ABC transporter permease [Sutterella sp.]MDO5530889.1 ABC transporter permease [Sutterella sp.]